MHRRLALPVSFFRRFRACGRLSPPLMSPSRLSPRNSIGKLPMPETDNIPIPQRVMSSTIEGVHPRATVRQAVQGTLWH